MITVNMHEAKTRLSQLIKAIEEDGEIVILQRNGEPVAEIHPYTPRTILRDLTPDPALRPVLKAGYDPSEPLDDEEWPSELR